MNRSCGYSLDELDDLYFKPTIITSTSNSVDIFFHTASNETTIPTSLGWSINYTAVITGLMAHNLIQLKIESLFSLWLHKYLYHLLTETWSWPIWLCVEYTYTGILWWCIRSSYLTVNQRHAQIPQPGSLCPFTTPPTPGQPCNDGRPGAIEDLECRYKNSEFTQYENTPIVNCCCGQCDIDVTCDMNTQSWTAMHSPLCPENGCANTGEWGGKIA